jgi:serine/threonine-protein kinase RsbW
LIHTTKFPARFESLESIGELTVQAAKEAGFDENAIYEVQLAVDEAATNIIEHAYGGEGRGDILISYEVAPETLLFRLHDHGKPFDPKLVKNPQMHLKLEELTPRGLGVFWMRKLMDEVRFEFSSDGGNTLTMIKKRPPERSM